MKDQTRVNVYFSISATVSCVIGLAAGRANEFEFHKLLNLIGLSYDLIAVVILSYIILTKEMVQDFIAHHLSLAIITFTQLFPVSFLVGWFFASGKIEMDLGMYAFITISLLPMLYIYSSPVLEPLSYKSYSPEKRVKILGSIILFVGFAYQLAASIIDTFQLTRPSI
jgi:hypothetical protein